MINYDRLLRQISSLKLDHLWSRMDLVQRAFQSRSLPYGNFNRAIGLMQSSKFDRFILDTNRLVGLSDSLRRLSTSRTLPLDNYFSRSQQVAYSIIERNYKAISLAADYYSKLDRIYGISNRDIQSATQRIGDILEKLGSVNSTHVRNQLLGYAKTYRENPPALEPPLSAENIVAELTTVLDQAERRAETSPAAGLRVFQIVVKNKAKIVKFIVETIVMPVVVTTILSKGPNEDVRALKSILSEQSKQIAELVEAQKRQTSADHKVVVASVLNVREEPDGRARVVGTLYLLQIVQVMKTSGTWSLVKYESGDLVVEGWVKSKFVQ